MANQTRRCSVCGKIFGFTDLDLKVLDEVYTVTGPSRVRENFLAAFELLKIHHQLPPRCDGKDPNCEGKKFLERIGQG